MTNKDNLFKRKWSVETKHFADGEVYMVSELADSNDRRYRVICTLGDIEYQREYAHLIADLPNTLESLDDLKNKVDQVGEDLENLLSQEGPVSKDSIEEILKKIKAVW